MFENRWFGSVYKEGKVLGACLDVLEYEDTSFEKFRIRNAQFEQSEPGITSFIRIEFSSHHI